jgi:hypothetical protein
MKIHCSCNKQELSKCHIYFTYFFVMHDVVQGCINNIWKILTSFFIIPSMNGKEGYAI